jgi:ketosteroid isomerase-like protein
MSGMSSVEGSEGACAAEDAFFAALESADVTRLEAILTDDFVLVDVMRGGVISRAALLDALLGEKIRFDEIERLESVPRRYGTTVIIVGRTQMRGRAGDARWSASSRYTHVYVEQAGRWQLASAQGTAIAPAPDP